uniref:CSON000698 protein n=1 Tax=Culicoides sonorensis TaxID=179676 RepID=A0A336MG92_CULSO
MKGSECGFKGSKNKKRGPGRPRKIQSINQNETDNQSEASIESENTYGILSDDDPGDDEVTQKRLKTPKQKLPPPIIIHNQRIHDVHTYVKEALPETHSSVRYKVDDRIKLFCKSTEDWIKLKTVLADKVKNNFYTFTPDSEKRTKVVLYGIPDSICLEYLKNKLHDIGLNVLEIKKLKLSKQRYKDQAHLLLYFNKNDNIRMYNLNSITTVDKFIVQWRYYAAKNKGPTQCSRCQNFGHSKLNCNLQIKCMRCAETHPTDQCRHTKALIINDETVKRCKPEKLKCANCGGGHTAVFKDLSTSN